MLLDSSKNTDSKVIQAENAAAALKVLDRVTTCDYFLATFKCPGR
jgi:hypothetical protein